MASKTESYDDMTVAELHEKAKEAGLEGTSHMKKDELIEALGKADSSGKSDKKDAKDGKHAKDDTGRARDEKGHFEKTDSDSKGHSSSDERPRDSEGHFKKTDSKK